MARGTKLTAQHITDSVGAVATGLSTCSVERANIKTKRGTTRLTFHVPVLDGYFFQNATDGRTLFAIPFPIVPFQQQFDTAGRAKDAVPTALMLESFSMSWDTRNEAAAIRSSSDAADYGKIDWQGSALQTLRLSFDEKQQTYFESGAFMAKKNIYPEVNLFEATISAESNAGIDLRANPFILTNINKQLLPYRTYVLTIDASALWNAADGKYACLPSLTISFECKADLVVRDMADDGVDVQNIPTPWYGDKDTQVVAQTVVNPTDPIEETAVQGNISAVDQVFLKRLEGGYPQESIPVPAEQILDDSCYECIVVPLWGNVNPPYAINATNLETLPSTNADKACTRRVIPIVYPFVLHHVLVAHSYMNPGFNPPNGAGVHNKIGVGLGQRGDDFAWQQIAYADHLLGWTSTDIDRIEVCPHYQHSGWQLRSIPLRGVGGVGYVPQGKPIFIGKATSTASRSTIALTAPATLGRETFLEVRSSLETFGGLAEDQCVVGNGGQFVFLIGKKPIVGDLQDVPV
jgi:hypothetical protein